jgi:hypothetical protein
LVDLPAIAVHEESAGTWSIVLPVKPFVATELFEDDLEEIAGDTTPSIITIVTAANST